MSQIFVSKRNSTYIPLAGGASFVGEPDVLSSYSEIDINISGAPNYSSGTLYFEFSPDGTNWDVSVPLVLNELSIPPITLRVIMPYFRVRYINGSTALTELRLTTVFHRHAAMRLTRFLTQEIDVNESIENIRAVIAGQKEDGSYDHLTLSNDDELKVSVADVGDKINNKFLGADRDTFGSGLVSSRVTQLEANFSFPIANSDVGTSVSGTGSVSQQDGYAVISSGSGTTSSASIFTNRTIKYSPGKEAYVLFTAAFTEPTSSNSHQRAGLFDSNNGFFVGFNGTQFGVTVRRKGIDDFVPLSGVSDDLLDGSSDSDFLRDGYPEAIDVTLYNIYRIRFGWLGAAPVLFEVCSPSGKWVKFHSENFPNTQSVPHITSPDLPVKIEIVKASSNSSVLEILTSSWDAGTTEDPYVFHHDELKGNTYKTSALAEQTTDQTILTVASGRIFKCTSIFISLRNDSSTVAGRLDIKDGGTGGTVLLPFTISDSSAVNTSNLVMNLTFPTPLRFSTNVFADIISGTLAYSITVVGYETRE